MSAKKLFYISSLVILPALYVLYYAIRLERWLPREAQGLLLLATLIVLERVYTYRYSVSQRSVLIRDISERGQ
jgi:hypothetical protein